MCILSIADCIVETHVLVRLVDDEATAIVLVARISAVTTDEKN